MSRHEITVRFSGFRLGCWWANDDGSFTAIAKGVIVVDAPAGGVRRDDAVQLKGGVPSEVALKPGLIYRFYGDWKEHHKHGRQFVFEAFTTETPSDKEGTIAYLWATCRGIGPRLAESIWDLYGADSVLACRERPDEVAAAVPRLTVENARKNAEILAGAARTEKTKISLYGLFRGRGIPLRIVQQAIDRWGCDAPVRIHRNPYLLMTFTGVGFAKADRLWLDLGKSPSRLKRQAYCCWHAVESPTDRSLGGDTWLPFAVVRDALRSNISSASVDVERALRLAVRGGLLAEKFQGGQRWIALAERAADEATIADLVEQSRMEAVEQLPAWLGMAEKISKISEHQRDNLDAATLGFVSVLSGRPGTGKTFTVARLVRLLVERFGENHVAIAAPTGKAAVRVTDAMASAGVEIHATTLHSLLYGLATIGEKVLREKFVIVDEASMIDVPMMKWLLSSRAEYGHILFVGDPNQLPPVGHGSPLRDLIAAKVPAGELIEIRRNSGRIVQACGEMIDRREFNPSPRRDLDAGENLLVIDRDDPAAQLQAVLDLLASAKAKFEAGATDAVDPIWGCQVVCAVNTRSELSRAALNQRIQSLLNPDGHTVNRCPFRVGDKIICGKNGQFKAVISYGDVEPGKKLPTQHYVANGEQAEVIDISPVGNLITARLENPSRIVQIPRAVGTVRDDQDDSPDGEESTGTGCCWELGYAISTHKSQGSEWPVVVVVLDAAPAARMVCSRQWLYTAVSRAKRLCVCVGRPRTAAEMVGRDALYKRKTFLREEIAARRFAADQPELLSLLEGVR